MDELLLNGGSLFQTSRFKVYSHLGRPLNKQTRQTAMN